LLVGIPDIFANGDMIPLQISNCLVYCNVKATTKKCSCFYYVKVDFIHETEHAKSLSATVGNGQFCPHRKDLKAVDFVRKDFARFPARGQLSIRAMQIGSRRWLCDLDG